MTSSMHGDFKHLYALVSRAEGPQPPPPPPPPPVKPLVRDTFDLVRYIRERDAFVTKIIDAAPGAIITASSLGFTSIDLLEFDGNDKFNDLPDGTPLLMLIKGPCHRDLRMMFASTGTMTGLQNLRGMMAPFWVHCSWNRSTNSNRICVTWQPSDIRSARQ